MIVRKDGAILCQRCCDNCKDLCLDIHQYQQKKAQQTELLCNGCCELCKSLCRTIKNTKP